MIGLRKLSPRRPDSIYAWRLLNGDNGVIQQTVNGRFEIPMDKMIIFVNQKEGENWEGVSLLRSAWMHWDLKRAMYRFQNIGAERQSVGVPIATKPTGTLKKDEDDMAEKLENLRTNEKAFMIVPTGWTVDIMDMKGGSTKNLDSYIQHHDRAITLNVLAQFLSLGSTSVGSYALSNDQSRLFILCLESIANYIADNINRYLIKKLVDYNFDVEKYPKIKFDKIGSVDQNIFTTSLQRLQQSGLFTPNSADEKYIRDVMDLPANDGKTDVDLTMFDSILTELDSSMSELDGTQADATAPAEDPANPGFDMNGQPMMDVAQAFEQIETWMATNHLSSVKKEYGSEVYDILVGAGGVGSRHPLSEETKKKISEALKRSKGVGGKGSKSKGKKTDPEVTKKNKEIAGLRTQVTALNNESRRKLLELKAKGEKLSPEDSAKMQLDLFDKKNELTKKIDTLKNEIAARKAETAASATPVVPKASDVGQTLDRINNILDGYEK
jgi:hypothetical protein